MTTGDPGSARPSGPAPDASVADRDRSVRGAEPRPMASVVVTEVSPFHFLYHDSLRLGPIPARPGPAGRITGRLDLARISSLFSPTRSPGGSRCRPTSCTIRGRAFLGTLTPSGPTTSTRRGACSTPPSRPSIDG